MPAKDLPAIPPGQPTPKKRSRFKLIMILSSLLLLLGAGGGTGYWWLYLRPDATGLAGLLGSSTEETQPATAAPEAAAGATGTQSATNATATPQQAGANQPKAILKPVALPSFTVNLADSPGNRYLKIGMEVEVSAEDAAAEIKNQTARIRDSIILLLSSKTVKELSAPEGKVLLKNEVAERLNQILGASRVVRIYFTDFVIQ